MKKILKKILLSVMVLGLSLPFSTITPKAIAFPKPKIEINTWPGNYNPKPGQEDGAYSFPGLYEPYYMLNNYNYAQWLRDYTAHAGYMNKKRAECFIEAVGVGGSKAVHGLVKEIKSVVNAIKTGSVSSFPWIALGLSVLDYNICMNR